MSDGHSTAYRAATPWLDDGDLQLYHGNVLAVLQGLPSGIAQTCVTSPPYWGLRDYGTGDAQLGLEATPDQYVAKMVEVFREVRRVLRDDGTLWLNIGDSYCSTAPGSRDHAQRMNGDVDEWRGSERGRPQTPPGLKPKDLVGIPWRLAFALQQDGWYLRSDIIWSKPNPMPESVTDRPTKAHEYVFLFSKQPRYFYDADAVREPHTAANLQAQHQPAKKTSDNGQTRDSWVVSERYLNPLGRNLRSVWQIATQPFPEAHFATYPEELVRRCILAGTSERGGCAECGAPWRRIVATTYTPIGDPRKHNSEPHVQKSDPGGNRIGRLDGATGMAGGPQSMKYGRAEKSVETTGWEPSCDCVHLPGTIDTGRIHVPAPLPQLVFDPFIGSGTTALVARKHGRRSIGIDLSSDYLAIAARRTQQLSLLGGAA